MIAYLIPTLERIPFDRIYPSCFYLLPTTGRECKRRAMCLSTDLNEIFRSHHSRCVCPPRFGQKRLRIARPGGCYLEWHIIRYRTDRAQNNKTVLLKDSAHLPNDDALSTCYIANIYQVYNTEVGGGQEHVGKCTVWTRLDDVASTRFAVKVVYSYVRTRPCQPEQGREAGVAVVECFNIVGRSHCRCTRTNKELKGCVAPGM